MGTVTFPTSSITTPSGDPTTLPIATTPLDGAEYMEVYQGGVWKYLTTDNFTAGRVINTGGVNVTGTTVPANGIYEPSPDVLGLAAGGVLRVSVSTSLVTLASGMGLTLTDGDVTLSEGKLTITDTANEGALSITANSAAASNVVSIAANGLSSGSALYVYSGSNNTAARSVALIDQDHSDAVNAYTLTLQQAAPQAFMNLVGTAGANTTDPISTLTTPGAIVGFEQIDVNGAKRWRALYADPS